MSKEIRTPKNFWMLETTFWRRKHFSDVHKLLDVHFFFLIFMWCRLSHFLPVLMNSVSKHFENEFVAEHEALRTSIANGVADRGRQWAIRYSYTSFISKGGKTGFSKTGFLSKGLEPYRYNSRPSKGLDESRRDPQQVSKCLESYRYVLLESQSLKNQLDGLCIIGFWFWSKTAKRESSDQLHMQLCKCAACVHACVHGSALWCGADAYMHMYTCTTVAKVRAVFFEIVCG